MLGVGSSQSQPTSTLTTEFLGNGPPQRCHFLILRDSQRGHSHFLCGGPDSIFFGSERRRSPRIRQGFAKPGRGRSCEVGPRRQLIHFATHLDEISGDAVKLAELQVIFSDFTFGKASLDRNDQIHFKSKSIGSVCPAVTVDVSVLFARGVNIWQYEFGRWP